jgi:ribulose-5-phosphate 4-epimerase/fuculose-1-phosphate aldolase
MSPVAKPAIKVVTSVREQVSAEEWDIRVNLAAAYRLTELFGMTDLHNNHITFQLPHNPNHFLINPFGLMYDEVKASNLITIDCDGNEVFNPTDYGVNRAGFIVHSAIHMARPDLKCVHHTHTPAGMAVSSLEGGLMALAQINLRFCKIAYHDFEGVTVDLKERESLVRDLGDHDAMILRNHGLIVGSPTVAGAFNLIYRLEQACQVQVMAMSCGGAIRMPPKDAAEETFARERARRDFNPDNPNTRVINLAWESLLRRLDRIDPSFRD